MNRSLQIAFVATLLVATTALACQVPVFRYALEQWESDRYEILVIHDGRLGKNIQPSIDKLKTSKGAMNVVFRTIDVSVENDAAENNSAEYRETISKLWSQHGTDGEAIAAVLYPEQAREIPDRLVHVAPLKDLSLDQIVDSPVRQEIAKRLLSGESAVWVFVPCSDEEQNAAALKTLKREMLINEERLELPTPDEIENDDVSIEATHIELRIEFSRVTVDRDDAREKLLLKALLRSEPDLESLDQPMAFPVLGRGRVLYALVGKGISTDTIAMASSFVVGPCSCQVKNLNPGFDLPLSVDWDEKLAGPKLSKERPEKPSEPVLLTIPPGRK